MEIKYPRRILAIGHHDSGVLSVVKSLTETAPSLNVDNSTAGLSHEWDVKTAYYTAKVPIWIDEISDTEDWTTEFLKPEAKEVVEAVGAWVYCFPGDGHGSGAHDETEKVLQAVQKISESHVGFDADVVMLAVCVPRTALPEAERETLEDMSLQYGFEFVDYGATGVNEFGENTGLDRIKEALEANEWDAAGDVNAHLLSDDDADEVGVGADSISGVDVDEAEWTYELFGMKAALADERNEEDEEDPTTEPGVREREVDDLDRLMGKLLAVKEQTADLPDIERKRAAAKAVKELMSEI